MKVTGNFFGKSKCQKINLFFSVIEELYNNCESDIIEGINEDDEIITKESVYQCSTCNFSFTDIEDHIQKYHDGINQNTTENDDEIVLEELSENNDNEVNLALIVKNEEGKYDCNECTKSFKVYKRFVAHLKAHHSLMVEDFGSLEPGSSKQEHQDNQYVKIQNAETNATAYRCKNCNTEFDSRKKLLLHLIIHKNVEQAQKQARPIKRPVGNINCKQCNKSFLSKLEFDLHVQAHDENRAIKPEKPELQKNQATTKKGVHACQYCGKEFKRPHEKVKHEVSNLDIFIRRFFRQSTNEDISYSHHVPRVYIFDLLE